MENQNTNNMMPVTQATDTEGLENLNIQDSNAGLIDDVSNGKFEQSMEQKQPINSLADARSAFEAMLASQNEPTTEPTEPTPVSEPTAPQAEPIVEPPIENSTFTPQAFDESRISSMIQDAIQQQVQSGKLPDLSANDISSQMKPDEVEPQADEPETPLIDIKSDEFYEKFVEDPISAIDTISDQKANEKVKAIMQELAPLMEQAKVAKQNKAITDTVRKFGEEYPDFGNYKDEMVRMFNEGDYQKDDINSYKDVYHKSKVNHLTSQLEGLKQQLAASEANRGKSLDDYLGEQESFDSLRTNENLKKAIIEDYIRELKDGGSPRMISGGNNQPSATPMDKVENFKDASNKFKAMFSH